MLSSLQDAVKRYLIESQLDPTFCNIANFWPPLILFPDLTSDYYRDVFEDEEKGGLSVQTHQKNEFSFEFQHK